MSGYNKNIRDGVPTDSNKKTTEEIEISSLYTAKAVANQASIETTTNITPCTVQMTSSTSKAPAEAYSTIAISPTNVDVLCGRGGGAIQHPGNRAFREIVMSKKPLYHSLPKKEKRKISKSIVKTIREKGGRFLQKREPGVAASHCKTGKTVWFEIGEEKAISKTCQALRERGRKKATFLSERKSGARQKKRVVSERTTQPSERSSDLPPSAAKKADRRNGSSQKQAMDRCKRSSQICAAEDATEGATREPIAILNGLSYTNGSGSWEWKLFDFCDEEQTRQDDQLVPYKPPLIMPPALVTSPCTSSKNQHQHSLLTLEQRQYQPEIEQMISSSRLYGRANSKPLAPAGSMPKPNECPVKREY
mmetsp:Transcript_21943/g.52226  ORF Transcript_21943/g.52226 Transcript_21943/m.52226 type:complete len:363 (-) Transcript_21943:245-1333(-)|eukprot:CAMPEP_0197193432 /NCGR_PEP_ID=MMETSP1423-20130617/27172_1 /TAXON_ID=476441 /ORGANISM="Pseudo-nitzschia heimii, Strain UNC1101" /LENGTH=362 /DNA_ID=CAMNT_0042646621 /DNA_START=312 /DNA_END=1400 /DNA_ORIENTATION=+